MKKYKIEGNIIESIEINESPEIMALYKGTGLPAPNPGKGLHTKKFHEIAINSALDYVKNGESPEDAMQHGYATAMKILGREGALKNP